MDTSGNLSTTNSININCVLMTVLQISATGRGTISPNYSNSILQIGKSYSVAATAASGFKFANWVISTNWVGGIVSNNATLNFVMQSNLTLQVNFADTNKPTFSITNLVAGQRVSNAVFTVKGTASDNWQMSNVLCQLNGGAWSNAVTANNWTNWSADLSLVPGTNSLLAYAADSSGNYSATNTMNFQYVVTNQLQLSIIGKGTISPNYSNAWLEIGRNYSITSAPSAGFRFTNWTGSIITNAAALNFMMVSNLSFTANFVDTNKPTLTITTPTANQRMTNALANIIGTASDNWQVTGVWYQLNSNAWNTANTTNSFTNWTSTTLTLMAGTNIIKAFAQDLGGNYSLTNTLSIFSTNAFNLQLNFTNAQPLTTNGLIFSLQLSTGLNGHIQVSTNLTSWLTLTNFIGTNSTITFRDPAATNSTQRFYRAVVP